MKKNILSLAVVILCTMTTAVFTACDNEDKPAKPTAGGATITIETAALYEELGITEDVLNGMAEASMLLTDTVMIYNAEGNLVSKLGTEVDNLQPQTLQLKDLKNGSYTIVAWQCVRGRKSGVRCWEMADEGQLSTVKITSKYIVKDYGWAIGMATSTINIDGGNVQVDIAPKSMGSVVEMKVDGFSEEKGLTELSLYAYTWMVNGFYLDPKRTDDDRWITEDYINVVAILKQGETSGKFFTMCQGDEMALYIKEIGGNEMVLTAHANIHAGDQRVFYCNLDRINWQPPFFGTPEYFSTWKADRDAGILVVDPCLKWGGNISDVEEHIKAKQWWMDDDENFEPVQGFGWYRYTWVANGISEGYYFKTEDGQDLCGINAIIYDQTISIETINASLMKQGYTYAGVYNNPPSPVTDTFFSADGKTEVMTYISDTGSRIIFYQPTDPDDYQYITN
jgi:hypothetical protein